MRVALSLLALLFCTPGNVWADAFLQTSFLNSDLSYGTGAPYQFGYDGESVRVNGNLWGECCAEFYEASGGVFVRQNVGRDAGGNVTSSEYLYEGGTFRIDFRLTNGGGANDVNGSFVAPIIGLRVLTSEPEGSPDAWYLLGPGVFDAPVARALAIGTHTLGGTVFVDMIAPFGSNNFGLFPGDYTSRVRGGWDGYTQVDVELPEPPLLILSVLIAISMWLRRVAFQSTRKAR